MILHVIMYTIPFPADGGFLDGEGMVDTESDVDGEGVANTESDVNGCITPKTEHMLIIIYSIRHRSTRAIDHAPILIGGATYIHTNIK